MKRLTNSQKLAPLAAACTSILLFLLLWHWGTQMTDLKLLIPGPLDVISAIFEGIVGKVGRHSILVHIAYSLMRVLAGFVIGSLAGVALGLVMGWYRIAEAIFNPLFRIIRPIPPIAWIPISIIWFGLGETYRCGKRGSWKTSRLISRKISTREDRMAWRNLLSH